MNLQVLKTLNDRIRGVIGREPEDFEDVFLFTMIRSGDGFHMRGVKNPLDIIFLDRGFGVIHIERDVMPENGSATAPQGTAYAVEVKAGGADHYGATSGEVWKAISNKVFNEGAI